MIKYIKKAFTIYGHGIVYIDLYGIEVEPNPNRASRVQAVIDNMGDKYLLAKPVERINGTVPRDKK
jgi:hypothetical protein